MTKAEIKIVSHIINGRSLTVRMKDKAEMKAVIQLMEEGLIDVMPHIIENGVIKISTHKMGEFKGYTLSMVKELFNTAIGK